MSLRSRFRAYAVATTGMTLALFSLGVYTAATGSGLACQAQWPLCSDQLIPALTINPDFIEWFHRVWAMVTGFMIIGLGAWSWLDSFDRRVRLAATAAVVVLPIQITVGAITVTIGGLVPGGYTVSTHAAHLLVALLIFTLLGLVVFWSGRRTVSVRALRLALGVGLAGLLAGALFSRAVPLLTYSPGAQATYYAVSLAAYLALLAGVVHAADAGLDPELASYVRVLSGLALGLLFVTLVLGRDLVIYTGPFAGVDPAVWTLVNQLALVGAVGTAGAGTWLVTRAERTTDRTGSVAAD